MKPIKRLILLSALTLTPSILYSQSGEKSKDSVLISYEELRAFLIADAKACAYDSLIVILDSTETVLVKTDKELRKEKRKARKRQNALLIGGLAFGTSLIVTSTLAIIKP